MDERVRTIEALHGKYSGVLFDKCIRILGNRAEAEDATQDVFERVLRRIGDYDPQRPLRPWIYRVATRVILNRIRAARTRRAREAASRRVPPRKRDDQKA